MIFLAADHRGFDLKEYLKDSLRRQGREVFDVGGEILDKNDDYVDFAKTGSEKVQTDLKTNKGIFICGSGHGMDMAANKHNGIRAALAFNEDVAKQSRSHEDSNVLVLAADWLSKDEAQKIVDIWLDTAFSGEERHQRRLEKIAMLE
jgi:ribose 5-phosphate isomerase B